ncbi:MAG TPA: DUF916 domain-containing protein [Thermomicrobiales bacterium]|nr:DUF916 domain-containing protein [Thermomicrobiales bacterium]
MNATRRFITVGLLLLSFVLWGSSSITVHAQTATPKGAAPVKPIEFSLNPKGESDGSFFDVEAKAGETKDLTVSFANLYDQPLTLRSYVADAYTVVNGGFGVRDEGVVAKAPTTWMTYPAATYTLKPKEGKEIGFSVSVPRDAKPGSYISALVLRTAAPIPIEGTEMFDQIIQKALAVVIRVPGAETPSFSIGSATYASNQAGTTVSVDITNTGNVFLKPTGTFAVVDGSGRQVLTAPVAMGSVYTGDTTQLQFTFAQPLAPGTYTIELSLKDGTTIASAGTEPLAFTVAAAATATASPVQVTDLAVAPGPDATSPIFATITGTIVNTGDPVPNARLTVHVRKDGKLVEDFQLIPSLSLAQGDTPINQRYIPATGFTKGTWTFDLTLESVETSNQAATVILDQAVPGSIIIP